MPHILLLEDNPEACEAIAAMLEALGHRVTSALNGAAGMVLLTENPGIALVITDIMMPVMDGISVIIEVRRTHGHVPVIAMTSRRDANYLRTAELLGAKATMFKPFSLLELKELVARVVKVS